MADEAVQKLRVVAEADTHGVTQMGRSLDGLDGSAKRTSGGLARMGIVLGTVGFSAATSGALSLAAGVGAAVKVAAGFEQSLANVGSVTGATTAEMALLRAEALAVGKDTSKSASESVEAFGELVKAGLSVQDVVGGAGRTVVQLAEATGKPVADMATLLSNSLNTFGLGADKAGAVADTLARAANASAIDVSDLGMSLSAVGPVAAQAGLTMDDFAAAMGLLGNNALKGSDAGTSLKTMLLSLAAPTDKARGLMDQLGIKVYDTEGKMLPFREVLGSLQTAFAGMDEESRNAFSKDIFGSDAIRASNILLKEGVEGWDKFGAAMGKAPTVADMSKARLATLNGQMEQLKGSLETGAIMLGEKFLPSLTKLAAAGVSGLNWLLATDWGSITGKFGGLGSAFSEVGTKAETGGALVKAAIDGVWAGLQGRDAAFDPLIVGIKGAFGEEAASQVTGFLYKVQGVLGELPGAAKEKAEELLAGLREAWAEIEPAARAAFEPVIDTIMAIIVPLATWMTDHWDVIWGTAETVVKTMFGYITGTITNSLKIIEGVFNILAGLLTGDWERMWTGAKQVAEGAWNQVVNVAATAVDLIKAPLGLIGAAVESMATGIEKKLDEVVDFFFGLPNRLLTALAGLAGQMTGVGADIVGGIISGIAGAAGRLMAAIKQYVTDAVPSWARSFLGISSPSTVMAKEVGEPVSAGVAAGIAKGGPLVLAAMRQMVSGAVQAGQTAAAVNLATTGVATTAGWTHVGGPGSATSALGALKVTHDALGIPGMTIVTYTGANGEEGVIWIPPEGMTNEQIFTGIQAGGADYVAGLAQASRERSAARNSALTASDPEWLAAYYREQAAIAAAAQRGAAPVVIPVPPVVIPPGVESPWTVGPEAASPYATISELVAAAQEREQSLADAWADITDAAEETADQDEETADQDEDTSDQDAETAEDFGESVGEFSDAASDIGAAAAEFGSAVSDAADYGSSGPEVPDPAKPTQSFASGGWIDRYSYLTDPVTGEVWGSIAEGGRRELIVPEAALNGGRRGGGVGNAYSIYTQATDAGSILAVLQAAEWATDTSHAQGVD